MKVKEERVRRGWVVLILTAIALIVFSGVAWAQPAPNAVTLSDLIELNASPTSIRADGISTSNITIAVFWPKIEDYPGLGEIEGYENLSGTPARNTRVDVLTTLGKLTDAENASNSGTDIPVLTGINGIAVVLLSGNVTGIANITAWAPAIKDMVNSILANNTTIYVVTNSTTVTFLKAEVTPTAPPSGGGGGGEISPTPTVTPTPTAGAPATPAVSPGASPVITPTPTAGAPATPTVSPGASPVITPSPSPSPTKKPLIPGFDAGFAIAGLLAVAYLVLRKKR